MTDDHIIRAFEKIISVNGSLKKVRERIDKFFLSLKYERKKTARGQRQL
jgi:hypothetical protein